MPDLIVATEYLEIASFAFARPDIRLTSLTGLWRVAYDGENTRAPYVQGRIGNQHYLEEALLRLPGFADGSLDNAGAVRSNARIGLQDTLEALYTAVLAPVTTGDGSRSAVWHKADGDDWTGNLHVVDFVPTGNKGPTIMLFDLVVKLAAGVWTAPVGP